MMDRSNNSAPCPSLNIYDEKFPSTTNKRAKQKNIGFGLAVVTVNNLNIAQQSLVQNQSLLKKPLRRNRSHHGTTVNTEVRHPDDRFQQEMKRSSKAKEEGRKLLSKWVSKFRPKKQQLNNNSQHPSKNGTHMITETRITNGEIWKNDDDEHHVDPDLDFEHIGNGSANCSFSRVVVESARTILVSLLLVVVAVTCLLACPI